MECSAMHKLIAKCTESMMSVWEATTSCFIDLNSIASFWTKSFSCATCSLRASTSDLVHGTVCEKNTFSCSYTDYFEFVVKYIQLYTDVFWICDPNILDIKTRHAFIALAGGRRHFRKCTTKFNSRLKHLQCIIIMNKPIRIMQCRWQK